MAFLIRAPEALGDTRDLLLVKVCKPLYYGATNPNKCPNITKVLALK